MARGGYHGAGLNDEAVVEDQLQSEELKVTPRLNSAIIDLQHELDADSDTAYQIVDLLESTGGALADAIVELLNALGAEETLT
jgi:anion-transporting  ArsA/GET3 family ATPase